MSAISHNIELVRERIHRACNAAGRHASEVTLIAVSKTVSLENILEAHECGINDFGENRPQELLRKVALLPGALKWHMIGHLQKNKVRSIVPVVHRVQSVDSIRLLELLDVAAVNLKHPLSVFLEVNISREEQKHGFFDFELEAALAAATNLPHLRVDGLMTVGELTDNNDHTRRQFAELRMLRDRLCPPSWDLSMGMSHDFENAILEGATVVRIGSAIFGDRSHATHAH